MCAFLRAFRFVLRASEARCVLEMLEGVHGRAAFRTNRVDILGVAFWPAWNELVEAFLAPIFLFFRFGISAKFPQVGSLAPRTSQMDFFDGFKHAWLLFLRGIRMRP